MEQREHSQPSIEHIPDFPKLSDSVSYSDDQVYRYLSISINSEFYGMPVDAIRQLRPRNEARRDFVNLSLVNDKNKSLLHCCSDRNSSQEQSAQDNRSESLNRQGDQREVLVEEESKLEQILEESQSQRHDSRPLLDIIQGLSNRSEIVQNSNVMNADSLNAMNGINQESEPESDNVCQGQSKNDNGHQEQKCQSPQRQAVANRETFKPKEVIPDMNSQQRLEQDDIEQIEEISDSASQMSHGSQFSEITNNNVSEHDFTLTEVSLPSNAVKIDCQYLDSHGLKPTPHADADIQDWKRAGHKAASKLWKKALEQPRSGPSTINSTFLEPRTSLKLYADKGKFP